MNLIHQTVQHPQFGTGEIVGQTDCTVAVQFSQDYGVRNFLYPSAFCSYLSLQNSAASCSVFRELKQYRKEQQRQAEQLQAALPSKAPQRPRTRKPAVRRAATQKLEDAKNV